jgi:hypothetical protein
MAKPESLSIKDVLSGQAEKEVGSIREQHEIYTSSHINENFSERQFIEAWNLFLSRLESPNIKTSLSQVPEFKPDYRFVLIVENTIQEEMIKGIKPELVAFLRKELKNSTIEILTEIKEKEGGRIIYTDDEKYREMLKKNPNLELLRQKFKLDFGD